MSSASGDSQTVQEFLDELYTVLEERDAHMTEAEKRVFGRMASVLCEGELDTPLRDTFNGRGLRLLSMLTDLRTGSQRVHVLARRLAAMTRSVENGTYAQRVAAPVEHNSGASNTSEGNIGQGQQGSGEEPGNDQGERDHGTASESNEGENDRQSRLDDWTEDTLFTPD